MSTPLEHVRPGDIISHLNWNMLVDSLNEAMQRIQLLESGGNTGTDLAVDTILPPGPYRVGDTLQINGRNFQFSAGAARIFIGAVQVLTLTPASTDTRLEFVIPNVPGVIEAGTVVDLIVSNQSQSVTRQITLRPRLNPLQGNITVEWQSVNPTTVVSGQAATFVYRIRSGTNNAATWSLTAAVDTANNAAAWNAQLRVLDGLGNVLNPREIQLQPGQQTDIQVQIQNVPAVPNGTSFGVSLTAASAGIIGSSGVRPFIVGTATPPPDTTMTLSTVPGLSQGLSGNTLTVPGGQSRPLAISAEITVAGTYSISRSVVSGAAGWSLNLDQGTLDNFTISAGDLTAGGGTTTRLLRYSVAATASAQASAQIQILVQRQGNASSRAIVLNVVRS